MTRTHEDIQQWIRTFIETRMKHIDLKEIDLSRPETVLVEEVFKASIDVVEFVLDLEEFLTFDQPVNLEKLAPRFMQRGLTLVDLMGEIEKFVQATPPNP
jgi:acyl carrier protein